MSAGRDVTDSAARGPQKTTDRREAIGMGVAALAGLGVSALARPVQAVALVDNMKFGQVNDAGAAETSLTSTFLMGSTMHLDNSGGGGALHCSASPSVDVPVAGFANTGSGRTVVEVTSLSTASAWAMAVQCRSRPVTGRGIYVYMADEASAGAAIEGTAWGTAGSTGLLGTVTKNGTGFGVTAKNSGKGGGVLAAVTSATNESPAMQAITAGSGYPIHAEGGKAQLYVKPAATTGAPTGGAHLVGEHFTDSAGREFVCVEAGSPGSWQPVLRGGVNAASITVKSPANASPAISVQANSAAGAALHVAGALTMTRSGRAKITKGNTSVDVTVSGGVGTGANILCTPQSDGGAGVFIRYAKRVSPSQFRIAITKTAPRDFYVAWMLLG